MAFCVEWLQKLPIIMAFCVEWLQKKMKPRKRNNRRKETYCTKQTASSHRTPRRRADDIVAIDRLNDSHNEIDTKQEAKCPSRIFCRPILYINLSFC